MKNKFTRRACRALIVSTTVLLASAASSRADLLFPVTITLTPGLETSGNGEFLIDFQLAPGTNFVTNQATISGFTLTGGSLDAANSNNFSAGGVTGSLATSLVLTNTSNLDNEFAEAFTSGVTKITFNVDQTVNPETGHPNAINEQFNVFVDDNSGSPVPTNDPTSNNTLISSVIVEGESIPNLGVYQSVSPEAGATAVPEPGSMGILLFGVLGLCARRKTFRRA